MPRFPTNIRAISLDLDDTLWPVGPTCVFRTIVTANSGGT